MKYKGLAQKPRLKKDITSHFLAMFRNPSHIVWVCVHALGCAVQSKMSIMFSIFSSRLLRLGIILKNLNKYMLGPLFIPAFFGVWASNWTIYALCSVCWCVCPRQCQHAQTDRALHFYQSSLTTSSLPSFSHASWSAAAATISGSVMWNNSTGIGCEKADNLLTNIQEEQSN